MNIKVPASSAPSAPFYTLSYSTHLATTVIQNVSLSLSLSPFLFFSKVINNTCIKEIVGRFIDHPSGSSSGNDEE